MVDEMTDEMMVIAAYIFILICVVAFMRGAKGGD
jgi:hypothetical protein